jgi:hypothetical protein
MAAGAEPDRQIQVAFAKVIAIPVIGHGSQSHAEAFRVGTCIASIFVRSVPVAGSKRPNICGGRRKEESIAPSL